MMGNDDETLMRYVDGELNEVARCRVERAVASDPALKARLDGHRALKARVAARYGPVAEEEVPERLSALLAGNVIGFSPVGRPATRRRWVPAAMAASLAAGMLAGQMLPRAGGDPVSFDGGVMIARSEAARALDTQLASAQPGDAAVRIGVSFPGEGGRACRTFETEEMSGLACRENDRWRVLVTAPGSSGGAAGRYAQASSADAIIMEAAQDMMTGDPFNAAAERRARDGGWTRSVGGDAPRP